MSTETQGTKTACGTPMVHGDRSASPCILPARHYATAEDSDHVDVHGHRAPVLVRQATIREVRRVQAAKQATKTITFQFTVPAGTDEDRLTRYLNNAMAYGIEAENLIARRTRLSARVGRIKPWGPE